ncbi:MAG: Kelch repeat-containing protein [Acidimicrobiia bacterium]
MIVWGGFGVASDNRDGELFADGAAYDPETDDWRRLPASPLEARQGHFAIWTGREVLIWGGPSPLVLADSQVPVDHNDGALYDPASKEWRRIPESPLSRRSESAVAYAAGRLLVWGGRDGRAPNDPGLADGAVYDVKTNRWTLLPEAPLPGRIRPAVAAVGDQVLIWSGIRIESGGDRRTDAALYNPTTHDWTRIADAPRPAGCFEERCPGTTTGSLALFVNARLSYDASTGTWNDMPDCAAAREFSSGQSTVAAADGLIAWGGKSPYGDRLPGASYHLRDKRWSELPEPAFAPRLHHAAIWTGDRMIVWGGISGAEGEPTTYHNDGAAYFPGEVDLSAIRECRPAPPPPPVD